MSRKRVLEENDCKMNCGTLDLQFFYFIGRMNPPTPAHIDLLMELVANAERNNTKAIIVIGKGPEGGVLSLDDPLTFDLKNDIINAKLRRPGSYEIIDNTSNFIAPIINSVSKQINEIERRGVRINSIQITQIAGSKDDDLTKLDFVKNSLVSKLSTDYSTCGSVTGNVLPFGAVPSTTGVPMSATSIRKDAYTYYLDSGKNVGSAFQKFSGKYGWFYTDYTEAVFRELLNPLINNTPRKIQMVISDEKLREYINGVVDDTGAKTSLNAKFYLCKKAKQTMGGRRRRCKTMGGRKTRRKTRGGRKTIKKRRNNKRTVRRSAKV